MGITRGRSLFTAGTNVLVRLPSLSPSILFLTVSEQQQEMSDQGIYWRDSRFRRSDHMIPDVLLRDSRITTYLDVDGQ